MARAVTEVTHNHAEAVWAAQAVTEAIFLARGGMDKADIRKEITGRYYRLNFTLDEIRPSYAFDVSCQGSVPQALEAFFEAADFEDAIRNAVSIGGDSDTIAAIAGSVAGAYFGIPEALRQRAFKFLDLAQAGTLTRFEEVFQR